MKRKSGSNRKLILKFISILTSFLIWIYVVSSAEVELTKEYDLNLQVPEGQALKTIIPKVVSFRVKGPGIFARKYADGRENYFIDQKKYYKKGKKKYTINLDKLKKKLPLGVELVSVEPRSISFELERNLKKKVEIKPIFTSSILEKFNVGDLVLSQKKMTITGPRSLVKKVKEIKTVELDFLKGGINSEVQIELVNPDSRIKLEKNKITGSIELLSRIVEKEFKNISIIFQSSGLVKYASTKKVSFVLSGDENIIDKIKKEQIQVLAIVPNGKNGKQTIKLISELPQGIKEVKIIPKSIIVDVE